MSEPRIPLVRGALVAGPAAYALSRVLDSDEIAERLAQCGLGERWQAVALAAVEAIDLEAAAWRRETAAHHRQPAAAPDFRDRHPQAESRPDAASSSPAMDVLTVIEAAGRLNVTPRHVRTLAATGRLPGRRHGRAWLLDSPAVAALAHQRNERRSAA